MNRTVIVAKIRPASLAEVARIFAESDATSLPRDLGVRERSLLSLGDLYVHLIDFDGDAGQAMGELHRHEGFRDINDRLRPHISPYLPTWQSPRDAIAERFYHWRAAD
jgi:cyclase